MPPTEFKLQYPHLIAYKVLDLNKNILVIFIFEDKDVTKTLVELRAYDHYSMCSGKYPENEHVKYNECSAVGETTFDTLYKATAMLAAAAVVLRNFPAADRNVYVWYVAATLWHHKVEEDDAMHLIKVVCDAMRDDTKERLAKVKHVYKNEDPNKVVGLPTLKNI